MCIFEFLVVDYKRENTEKWKKNHQEAQARNLLYSIENSCQKQHKIYAAHGECVSDLTGINKQVKYYFSYVLQKYIVLSWLSEILRTLSTDIFLISRGQLLIR